METNNKEWQRVGEETERQYTTDMFLLALNDPEIMGKDVLGYKRLCRVLKGVSQKYDDFHGALLKDPEADYVRAKLDEAMLKFVPKEAFCPFHERYDHIMPERYDKRK